MSVQRDTVIDPPGNELALRGHVEVDVAALFIEQLAEIEGPLRIDLCQAKLVDPLVVDMLAECFRQTAQRLGGLELIGAPTALARALEAVEQGLAISYLGPG